MKYAFAGDREISVIILSFLMSKGYNPSALLLSKTNKSSHAEILIEKSGLEKKFIFRGSDFKNNLVQLQSMGLDYIFGIHFPYIIPIEFLNIPKIGFLNLHPAYLPFNKGWHTPSWAIIDNTPIGATLHFMSERLDEGDIIHQKSINVEIDDTANSLYQKLLKLEEDVFKEAFSDIEMLRPHRIRQKDTGTTHFKNDLEKIRYIRLDEKSTFKEFLNKIRALSTNDDNELAYFVKGGNKIGVKISFVKLSDDDK
jgi:methionyl-tRNA formyltransferase